MDKVFGEYLVKCKVNKSTGEEKLSIKDQAIKDVVNNFKGRKEYEQALAAREEELRLQEESKGDEQNKDLDNVDGAEAVESSYERVSVDDALVRTSAPYVAILFTAEYCPPCEGFMQPFREFIEEANRVAGNPKFQVLIVNCDKQEE